MATTIFKLPDSGQLHCYDRHGHETLPSPGDPLYGQDGCFRVNPLAFAKLDGEGREMPDVATWQDGLRMIFDRNTGLTWEVKSPNPAISMTPTRPIPGWRLKRDMFAN